MSDSIPPVEAPRQPHPLIDLLAKLAPALILAIGGWALTLEVRVSLHDQRIAGVEARAVASEAESRIRGDRLTAALDAQRDQIAQLQTTVARLGEQVAGLTRAIERMQGEPMRPIDRRR